MWTKEQRKNHAYSKEERQEYMKKYSKEYLQRPEVKEHRREYAKEYRKRPKAKEYSKEYEKNRREIHLENAKKWYHNHEDETKQYRETHKDYYANYRLIYKEKQKKITQERRLRCLIHYSGNPPKCECCGETIDEFLTIDHIHNDGAEHRREEKSLYNWLIKNNFPKGYRVLCWNCNCGRNKTKDKICPHKRLV